MVFPEEWHAKNGIWPLSGLLEDSIVADIRAQLPFGPLPCTGAELFAEKFNVNPMTIIRIATGQSYCRPSACPDGHPLKLSINAENATKQRLRYQAQKHRKSLGEAQDWKCKYCECDISGKGASHLDHIVPVAKGGTSSRDNLQLLCRRCNIRKSAHQPDEQLHAYMDRKVIQDRLVEQFKETIPPIINSLLWPDTTEAMCLWCESPSKVIQKRYSHPDATVFRCLSCRRMFRSSEWVTRENLYSDIQYAIHGSWYADDTALSIVRAVAEGKLAVAENLIRDIAGDIQEVKKCRHRHRQDGGCWCEFGGDGYEVIGVYSQDKPHRLILENTPLKQTKPTD